MPFSGYVCRVGAELGGDIVKSDYPGRSDALAQAISMCPRPIIVEESPLPLTPEGTLRTVAGVLEAGGAGVMFAHRIWEAPQPRAVAEAVAKMIHENWSFERAVRHASA